MQKAEKTSDHYIEKNYGESEKCLRDWSKIKDKLKMEISQKRYKLAGGGRKSINNKFKPQILEWSIWCRKIGIVINTSSIIAYTVILVP